MTLKAKIGDVFVVESADGTIHEIHSPSIPERKIVFPSKTEEKRTQEPTEAGEENVNDR